MATKAQPEVHRITGTVLTDEEIALMKMGGLGGPSSLAAGEDGLVEMTEAEAALLEAQGSIFREIHTNEHGFDRANPNALNAGDTLWQISTGQDQFTGRIKDVSDNAEKVFMWRPTGEAVLLPKNKILFWITQAGFLPRPPDGITLAPRRYLCPTVWAKGRCKKANSPYGFTTPQDAYVHFKVKHPSEFEQKELAEQQQRQDQMDRMIDAVVNGGGGGSAELTAAIVNLTTMIGRADPEGEPPTDPHFIPAGQEAAKK